MSESQGRFPAEMGWTDEHQACLMEYYRLNPLTSNDANEREVRTTAAMDFVAETIGDFAVWRFPDGPAFSYKTGLLIQPHQ